MQPQEDLASAQPVALDAEIPLLLEVFLNGQPTDLIAAFTFDPQTEAISATRDELIEVGVRPPQGAARILDLADIDGPTYRYDATAQTIALEVAPEVQQVDVISANRTPPPITPDATWGAVLNYDASLGLHTQDINAPKRQRLNIGTNAWIFSPYGILSNQGVIGIDSFGETDFTRLETTFQTDSRAPALTFSVGDIATSSVGWSRPLRLGGVQLRREFALRNDIVSEPLLSFEGAAALPSTVDVFIDNNRVFGGQLNQGPFRVDDIPIFSGAGEALVVVRDINGVEARSTVPFFASRNLLKEGIMDFSLEAGVAREGFGLESDLYGDAPIISGSARYGISNRLTVEFHFETTDDLVLAGGGFNTVIADRAELGFATGQSDYAGQTTQFNYGTFRTQIGQVSVQGSALRSDPGFVDLARLTAADVLGEAAAQSQGSLLDFPNVQDVISVGFPLADESGSVNASYVRSLRGETEDEIVSVTLSRPLNWRDASLNLRASYDFIAEDSRVSGSLAFAYGDMSVQVSADRSDRNGNSLSVNLFQQLDETPGSLGYRTGLDYRDRQAAIAAAVSTRTAYGIGEIAVSGITDNPFLRGRFQGALATVGTTVAAGGPINDGFAIVDVGIPDVPIDLQNREVAISGANGRALVGGLSSFGRNRVSVNPLDLPEDTALASTGATVTPSRRSGVLVNFGGSTSADSALVTLVDVNGAHLPVGSVITVNGNPGASFVVGFDGTAFLTGLSETNSLIVDTGAGDCAVTVPRAALSAEAGPIVCG